MTNLMELWFYILIAIIIIWFAHRSMTGKTREDVGTKDALLNPEELEKHAKEIAKTHTVSKNIGASDCLVSRMDSNFQRITSVYKTLNNDVKDKMPMSPAAEWLLDNFYVIEEQVKDIRRTLVKEKCIKLNLLSSGPLKGFPRVYAIALELVSHLDGRLDEKLLVNFVKSYQTQKVLSMAELWSLSLMLKMALVENIKNICEKMMESQIHWLNVDQLMSKDSQELESLIKEHIKGMNNINSSFVEYLLKRLRKEGIESAEIYTALDRKLLELCSNVDKVIQEEHQEQATRQVSMGNSVTSLRLITSLNWNEIFENLSFTEDILRKDPEGIYARMDFSSRDYYRHEVERIAKILKTSETNVARKALDLAWEADDNQVEDEKLRHVGNYLIGKGKDDLLKALGHSESIDKYQKNPLTVYFVPILLLTGLITLFFINYAHAFLETRSILITVLVGTVILIPVSDIAITFVNWIITHRIRAGFLPKMEYGSGIPEDSATMIVIPTLLPNAQRAKELLKQLEVHYLSSKENNLYYALLGDYKDSAEKDLSGDKEIISVALEGIKELNQKYSPEQEIFFFFHRHRQYAQSENKWMGWERKRGALVEFNQLLKGAKDTSYSIKSGDITNLPDIKYVITVDADTRIPLETAKKLIGTISHPLNKGVIDEKMGRVVEGYGLIQPRISVNVESSNASLFSRIFAGQSGIDPYTTAVSDLYQDLFGEGIFTGKGIYDVEIFHKVLNDAIEENTVLSHDLLEGNLIRVGLATDLELVDAYPSGYNSYMMRLHRWVRGDWQLIKWLFPRINNRLGKTVNNPLSTLSKWKIIDNLRRSLVSVTLMILFILGLTIFPGNSLIWVLLGITTIVFPLATNFLDYLMLKHYQTARKRFHGNMFFGFEAVSSQVALIFLFLPYHAYMMADAIFRTLYRVFVSKRNLLEWVTAADVERNLKNDVQSFIKKMAPALVQVAVLFLLVILFSRNNLLVSFPLLVAWAISPLVAYNISKLSDKVEEKLEPNEISELRRLARKTWAYYEDFAEVEDNFLPPDNYQENPPNGVAHRTSPTNIGFLLIAILSARDLGYISTREMAVKIRKTLTTVEMMDKWKGHLFNWYDTTTLEVLRPRYISTVDSGNFVGYLMTLKQGLKEYLERPLIDVSLVQGLKSTLELSEQRNEAEFEGIDILINKGEVSLIEWRELLEVLSLKTGESCGWNKKFRKMIDEFKEEVIYLFPVTGLFNEVIDNGEYKSIINIVGSLEKDQSLLKLKNTYDKLVNEIEQIENNKPRKDLAELKNGVIELRANVENVIDEFNNIIEAIDHIITNTQFSPLYDEKRNLFSIGYNVEEEKLTNSYYDLLASEARITSFLAVARREIPKEHWFKLGRSLTEVEKYRGLVSWTGTMFEYIMPYLIMRNYDNTLLDETYLFVVKNQVRYGDKRGVPWGTSESGFYAFDLQLNYQYKAFGVPDLGLKRGLINDMVVSPYSTILALPFNPKSAMLNLQRLKEDGVEGYYGFYEAVDYTPERVTKGKKHSIVQSFMAHHQGMSFITLNNFLNPNIMQERFHSDPVVTAGELLLQEKIPVRVIITKENKETIEPLEEITKENYNVVRNYEIPDTALPACHMLSNGRYSVMITNGGSGYSRKEGLQVTRWREDVVFGKMGTFIFLQNIKSNATWSATYEPYNVVPDEYKVNFHQYMAEFIRKDDGIDTHTEIVVSPEDNAEIRQVSLTNHGDQEIIMDVTSYFEIIMAPHAADVAHPAFSNLFVRTELLPKYDSIIASRRPREEGKETIWAVHTVTVEGDSVGGLQYETDRSKFIGRGRNISNPLALEIGQPLTNTVGAVLDPIMSLRRTIKIAPGNTVRVSYMTAIARSREEAVELAEKYYETASIKRAFELAWTRSQVEAGYLNLKPGELETYQDMLSQILFLSPLRRKHEEILLKNVKGQSGLWAYGISGDVPIVLVVIKEIDEADLVQNVLKAHEFWKIKGLAVDLVILNEDESSYLQPLQDLLRDMVLVSHAREIQDTSGGVFIRNGNLIPEEDKSLLYTVARIVLRGDGGPISHQIKLEDNVEELSGEKIFKGEQFTHVSKEEPLELTYFNNYGGFTSDGKEYVIRLKEGMDTPAPWINVISNSGFGFQVSESGSGFTWSENSRENKLTPWNNDPVSDTPGEVLYLRDEDNGEVWSITPLPIREKEPYTIRHGLGYSVFHHGSHGIEQDLTLFVSMDDPVKISIMKLKNTSGKKRKLTLTYYIKPVMGVSDQITQQYLTTGLHEETGTIVIQNPYNSEFEGRIAFVNTSEKVLSYTGDRMEFIGPQGDLSSPQGLKRVALSNRLGAGFNPCVALQVSLELEPEEEKETIFLFGHVSNIQDVTRLVSKYKNPSFAQKTLSTAKKFWAEKLGTISVNTPDVSMNLMLNSWLLYQTISCRIWARSAFYQSGGAYGFRDQLQDVMSVAYAFPELTRKQILLHCAHQFVEGDVQHWWHPGSGDKGVRTRFSDDLLWLPFVTSEYIRNTGDYDVLKEEVHYLEDAPLGEHEDERYGIPKISQEKSSVYEHCIRTLERSLKFGEHGIPLMGSGDWNDGMSTVGNKGKGESVWLGWFLYTTLNKFTELCKAMDDHDRAARYQEAADQIVKNIELNAWDGKWYRRAYFDDGTPLGASENMECKIDSLAQSWAVISGAGDKERVKVAMESVEHYLVRKDDSLVMLFTPPFDSSDLKPGYIKGYVPGVRENGGQYTHAAIWVIYALAQMGKGDKAWELFNMINPVNHGRTSIESATYKVEPYVIAADVYAVPPHVGRGGWTWYTGAAGWMYRVALEYILGLRKHGDKLLIDPCIPQEWPEYSMTYKYEKSTYHIKVKNPHGVNNGVTSVSLDGKQVKDSFVNLVNDGKEHHVEAILGGKEI